MEQDEYKVERPEWWPPGPWMTEPDKAVWKTKAGLPGMIVRTRQGNLCGYVAVAKDHPAFGVMYDDIDRDIDVHGGLTYSNACAGHICHVPESGEPDEVWWFGFDCAHGFDWRPSNCDPRLKESGLAFLPGEGPFENEVYRDFPYVRGEVESLARQLASR